MTDAEKIAAFDALTTEAQGVVPSAEAMWNVLIGPGRPRIESRNFIAAIEHRDLVFARRAQIEREGMRKALEELFVACLEAWERPHWRHFKTECPKCEKPAREENPACLVHRAFAALTVSPEPLLGEFFKTLREGREAALDPLTGSIAASKIAEACWMVGVVVTNA